MRLPHVLPSGYNKQIKVVATKVAYMNRFLILELKKRAQSIAMAKFNQVNQIDKNLDYMIKENRERFTTPIYAFVTFDCQEGVARCD